MIWHSIPSIHRFTCSSDHTTVLQTPTAISISAAVRIESNRDERKTRVKIIATKPKRKSRKCERIYATIATIDVMDVIKSLLFENVTVRCCFGGTGRSRTHTQMPTFPPDKNRKNQVIRFCCFASILWFAIWALKITKQRENKTRIITMQRIERKNGGTAISDGVVIRSSGIGHRSNGNKRNKSKKKKINEE